MKILHGKFLSFFLVFFSLNFLYCEELSVKKFYGEYEYSYFVAPYDNIDKDRINFLVDSEFNKLILSTENFTAGLYKYDKPSLRIDLPDQDGTVDLGNKSYTCSYFIDLLTKNRKYKEVIVINNSCVVEIIDDVTLAFNGEGGWFVYKKKSKSYK